jgi:hypothetical protein
MWSYCVVVLHSLENDKSAVNILDAVLLDAAGSGEVEG